MTPRHYKIKMGNAAEWEANNAKEYSPSFQTDDRYSSSWRGVLQTAHGFKNDRVRRNVIQCRCHGDKTKDEHCLLEVRELEGTFFLAKKKNTGTQHNDDCRFFKVDRGLSGLKGYDQGAVDDEGGIKVGLGLQRQEKGQVSTPAASKLPRSQSAGHKHKQVSLLGLLQILWNAAGLNYCKPGSIQQRNNLPFRLYVHAEPIKIKSLQLADHLLIYDMASRNRKVLKQAVEKQRRLFVIALLAPWTSNETSESGVLPIETPAGIPNLRLPEGRWESTCNSYARVVQSWREGKQTIAIAQIEPEALPTGLGYRCTVVGLALMRVTDYWLPVESGYEHDIADKLVAEGRRFIKPLRYDADEDEVFPDFILLDTDDARGTPLEVFGMTHAEYLARREAKTKYYDEEFGLAKWWSWTPREEPTPPSFPDKAAV